MGHLEIVTTIRYCHGRVGGGASHWHFTIAVNSTRTQLLLAISYLGREKAEGEIPLFLLTFQRHVSGATWPNPLEGSQQGRQGTVVCRGHPPGGIEKSRDRRKFTWETACDEQWPQAPCVI